MYKKPDFNLKNKILFITAIAFVIVMLITNFSIHYIKNKFIENGMHDYNRYFQLSYKAIQESIHEHINHKLNYIIEENNQQLIKDIFIHQVDYQQTYKKFNKILKNLQKQAPYAATLHIYDKNGISKIRAHKKDRYGDDLKTIRPMIKSLVPNPRNSCFFELGVAGFYFRVVEPIYYNKELLGFIEIGIKPTIFIKKIKQFRGVESLFFIKKDFAFQDNHQSIQQKQIGEYVLYPHFSVSKQNINLIPSSYQFEDDQKVKFNNHTLMLHTLSINDIYGNELGKVLSIQDFWLSLKKCG
ncbi:MAG: cache domain-containing protein [Campylobacterota bacterium]|nr:cache domain-containing protein [Campylobacterota bacterium]